MESAAKIAVLFPGQGSQYLGMAKDFLEQDQEARALMAMAEKVSGLELTRLCLEGPMNELTRTLHLQPALTVVNLICWQAAVRAGLAPDFVAGHSLGEYAALVAAGVLEPATALELVTERGRLMEREAAAHPGGMQAVVKLTIDQVREIVAAARQHGVIAVANHNSAQQVVLSGQAAALAAAAQFVKERGGKAIPLKVSGPWHSELVAGAVADFAKAMAGVSFASPRIPLLFNVTAAGEDEAVAIREIMARQIASTVRWYETVQHLLEAGVRIFIEAGPKNVLSGLLKKIVPQELDCRILQFDSPASLAGVMAELP